MNDNLKFKIEITKTKLDGTPADIKPDELGDFILTLKDNINDISTSAHLQVGSTWDLTITDIKEGKIVKDIALERDKVETTFALTLTHSSIPIQGVPAVVVVPCIAFYKLKLLDLQDDNCVNDNLKYD